MRLKVKKNILYNLLNSHQYDIMNQEVKLRIYGMTCEDCVATITRGLEEQPGVLDVNVSLKNGTGIVKVNLDEINPKDLLKNKVFVKPSHYKATLLED